jgi:arylsulfatase
MTALLLAMLGCSGGDATPEVAPVPSRAVDGERPPDVVLVSIDTLRPDRLGTYGHERDTSPFLDGLAEEGVRFAHARSASPWTLPAHTTMLTGQLPTTHLVIEDDLRLPDSTPVLPEQLKARGMHTAGVVGTLFVSSMYRFDRGFDHFNDFGIHDKKTNLQGLVSTEELVDDLIAFVDAVPEDEPLFLFLHTYDVHYAYDPPAPYDTMFDRAPQPDDEEYRNYFHYAKNPLSPEQLEHQLAQYDEAIRYVDDQLARLAVALEERGRSPRWVVTSDHGEEFGERGAWGHAHTLYAEQLRVPLIVSGPGLPSGVVIEERVGTHDIAPTIAAWTQVELDPPDGIDLTPHLSGDTPIPDRVFLAETSRHGTMRLGLLADDQRIEWDLGAGSREVFAADDIRETTPLSVDPGPMTERLIRTLGTPWTANENGVVHAKKGRVLVPVDGGGRARRRQAVTEGMSFAVYPLDTLVQHVAGTGDDAKKSRRQGLTGGQLPNGPLGLTDPPVRPAPVDLSSDLQDALKSIGYLQDD